MSGASTKVVFIAGDQKFTLSSLSVLVLSCCGGRRYKCTLKEATVRNAFRSPTTGSEQEGHRAPGTGVLAVVPGASPGHTFLVLHLEMACVD